MLKEGEGKLKKGGGRAMGQQGSQSKTSLTRYATGGERMVQNEEG